MTPSAHAKCDRCWHYRADVGVDPAHPAICGPLRGPTSPAPASRAGSRETPVATRAPGGHVRPAARVRPAERGASARPPEVAACRPRPRACRRLWQRWLWVSAGGDRRGPDHEGAGPREPPRRRRLARHPSVWCLMFNTGAAFSFLAAASVLAALALCGDRGGRGDRDRRAAAARRQRALQRRAGADPRRRAGLSPRPPRARQGRRLPAVPLRGVGVSCVQRRGQRDHGRRGAAHRRQLPPAA